MGLAQPLFRLEHSCGPGSQTWGWLAGFKYRQVIKKLKKLGFAFDRQAAGSHEIWYNPRSNRYTTIPNHPGDLPEGTLRAILRQAGVPVAKFLDRYSCRAQTKHDTTLAKTQERSVPDPASPLWHAETLARRWQKIENATASFVTPEQLKNAPGR